MYLLYDPQHDADEDMQRQVPCDLLYLDDGGLGGDGRAGHSDGET